MAKASAKDTPDWLPLDQALKHVADIEQSVELGELNLRKALVYEHVPGRAGCLIIGHFKTRELLDQGLPGHAWNQWVKIDFANNQSTRPGLDEGVADRPQPIGFKAYRLAVRSDKLFELWPKPTTPRPGQHEYAAAKTFVHDEYERMKSAKRLPTSITKCAHDILPKLNTYCAAEGVDALKVRGIEAHLRAMKAYPKAHRGRRRI